MSPLGEHVGSLFDYVDRHDHHGDGPYPLAHHPVTSFHVSGPVRFPLGLRLDRRDEALTQWAAVVAKHVPALPIPTNTKARNRLQQQVDSALLQDPECRARHEPCRTKIALAVELVEEAIRCQVPLGVVVFDAWYLAEDVVRVLARRRKNWINLLKKNRRLDTASVHRRDAHGWPLKRRGPQIAVEALGPLIPAHAYRPLNVGEHPSGCLTLGVRIPGLGQVCIVASVATEQLTERAVVVVANPVDWSAAKSIGLSWQRWPTDTFDQDSQGPLGVNEYRRRSAEAMGTHGWLVSVASSLVHLTCLPAGPDRTNNLLQSMGDACRPQGRVLLQPLLVCVQDRLCSDATVDHVFGYLVAKKRGIVPD